MASGALRPGSRASTRVTARPHERPFPPSLSPSRDCPEELGVRRRVEVLARMPRGRIEESAVIRKLSSGQYRLYSRKTNPTTGKRRNLGTFKTRAAAQKHEREVQYFKRH
jgi:hypothetical protein